MVWLHPLNLFFLHHRQRTTVSIPTKVRFAAAQRLMLTKRLPSRQVSWTTARTKETETLAWVEKNLQPKEALRSLFRATMEMEKWAEQQSARWQWGMRVDFGGILPMLPKPRYERFFSFFYLGSAHACTYDLPLSLYPPSVKSWTSQHFWV